MASTLRPTAVVAALALLEFTVAQQPGTVTPEVHPQLTTSKCTTTGGCVEQNTSVVLDWNYRWIHTADYASCTTSTGINSTLCPDQATCSQNCLIEGANYTGAGIVTSGSSMTLSQYVPSASGLSSVSPRVYLLDNDNSNYVSFQLLGQELTFDVDLSTLPCGQNGALYLSEMDITGGRSELNTGAANYGAGYCDAQCPVETWKNGTLNTDKSTFCCNEMDILESNRAAAAFTPHPCADDASNCDKGGCGFNPYNQGFKDYWATGGTVDTSKPFTVITQFITDDGTTSGTLSEIRRIYQQGSVTVPSAISAPSGDSINSTWCSAVDGSADQFGNLKTMGQALGRGMVLAFSMWNDAGGYMNWLDEGSNGPCNATEGNPTLIQQNEPGTHVVFSNIKWGDIGSTFSSNSTSSKVKRGMMRF
ncbi:glycosylhydrolase family 7-1 [Diaporthe amygdali]|uniref:glycosylhydrolase family 7-1 n=1 Tax=Phomopsis amygdali TaxID=1214568 RepID=UPI0022FDE1EA|nr:glycosylhydrolase family 7-1 [Diaporthe amygdali]KAJ0120789.1 glycosylhydrolase family 7-1 [Diaporthe amygdali]